MMTKYAISPEGVASLRALSKKMKQCYLDAACQTRELVSLLAGLDGKLGIYGELALEHANEIWQTIEELGALVASISSLLQKRAEAIEELYGFNCDDSDNSDPIYDPKVKARPFILSSSGRTR